MICINIHNVNQALAEGLRHLAYHGKPRTSRNGDVLVSPWPVMTTYADPTARVLFSPLRNASPFFHLMEALWMLAGRNDLTWPRLFNKRMKEFSDNGLTINGAYGYRWRHHFNGDQLSAIIRNLRENPTTRRCVLGMWDVSRDLGSTSLDIPCNTHVYVDTQDGKLNITVCCRSNDIWWGAYGANAVHFSILQEYLAAGIGVPVGRYSQLSNNFHLYPAIVKGDLMELSDDVRVHDPYTEEREKHTQRRWPVAGPLRTPLVNNFEAFDRDLGMFMADPTLMQPFANEFFTTVAVPMYQAWVAYKVDSYAEAFDFAYAIQAGDWKLACVQWLERRRHIILTKEAGL